MQLTITADGSGFHVAFPNGIGVFFTPREWAELCPGVGIDQGGKAVLDLTLVPGTVCRCGVEREAKG